MINYRVILFHKQSTSARLRFLKFSYNSVCAFESIPMPANVHADLQRPTAMHPAPVIQKAADELGLSIDDLKVEEGYRFDVEVPGEYIRILLVGITSMDPPFSEAEAIQARFIDLTEARGLPGIELELLRGAYEYLLGG